MLMFFPSDNLVISVLTGAITVRDFLDATVELNIHPEHLDGMKELWDLRTASLESLTGNDIMLATNSLRRFSTSTSRTTAFVVSSDLNYGMISMWNAYADMVLPKERRIFRDYEDAREWILGFAGETK